MPLDILAIDKSYPRMDALFDVMRDVYATSSHMSETFQEKFPMPSALVAEVADASGRPGALFLVAEEDRHPRGFLVVKPRRPARLRHTADLNMGVHSGARGRGIGGRLIGDALARVARSGVVEIVYLMVRADNRSATALYERMGFDRVAILQQDTKIDDRYYDGVLMRRWIRRPPSTNPGVE